LLRKNFELFAQLKCEHYAIMYIFIGESFPTIIRGTGVALCIGIGRLGPIIAEPLFEVIVESHTVLHYFGGTLFALVLAILVLSLSGLKETQDIQLDF